MMRQAKLSEPGLTQETLNGYYNVLYMILRPMEYPLSSTDRRTVFEYSLTGKQDEKRYVHPVLLACSLGIAIKCSSVLNSKPG